MTRTVDTATVTAIIGVLGSMASYLFGSRQRTANARATELENVEKVIKFWKDITEYQKTEIEALRSELEKKCCNSAWSSENCQTMHRVKRCNR